MSSQSTRRMGFLPMALNPCLLGGFLHSLRLIPVFFGLWHDPGILWVWDSSVAFWLNLGRKQLFSWASQCLVNFSWYHGEIRERLTWVRGSSAVLRGHCALCYCWCSRMEYAFSRHVLEGSLEDSAKHPLQGPHLHKGWFWLRENGKITHGRWCYFRETVVNSLGRWCFREIARISHGRWWPLCEIFRTAEDSAAFANCHYILRKTSASWHDFQDFSRRTWVVLRHVVPFSRDFKIAPEGLGFLCEDLLWRVPVFHFCRILDVFCGVFVFLADYSSDFSTYYARDEALATKVIPKVSASS